MTEAEWIEFLQRPEIPAFNRAMLTNPDDDLPRLVFADWLDENCPDTRVGAVVRESMSGRPCTFHFLPVPAGVNVHADRGRLRLELESNPPPPDEHGCRAMWESGWVGRVRLRNSSQVAVGGWLGHSAGMAGIEGLEINDATMEVAELMAAVGHLTAVQHLDLSLSQLGADGVRVLATANLPALRSLTLFHCRLGDEAAIEIASTPTFAPLTALDLGDNDIDVTGLMALTRSPHLTRLRSLHLIYNALPDEGAVLLAHSPSLAGLQSLNLYANRIGLIGMTALCNSRHLARLTTLKLSCNSIGDEGVRALAASPHLMRLETLDLESCFDSPAGAVALAESTTLPELRSLDLSSNPIGDAGLIALAASPLFNRLDKLSLARCGISVAGLRALAASPRLADPRPLELWLTDNAFGEDDQAVADELPPTLAAAVRTAVDWGIDRR